MTFTKKLKKIDKDLNTLVKCEIADFNEEQFSYTIEAESKTQ